TLFRSRLTHRRIDTSNPQPAEFALALLPVPVRIRPAALHCVLCDAPQLGTATEIAARCTQVPLLLVVPRHRTRYACHVSLPASASCASHHPARTALTCPGSSEE